MHGPSSIGAGYGGTTFKLKFGHRGSNHPVQDLRTGRVYITSQNHGYAVDDTSLPDFVEITHRSVNDGTVEGMRHKRNCYFLCTISSRSVPRTY